jgi:prepilin-type N-terminal cleavage/methylation domain-containing protein
VEGNRGFTLVEVLVAIVVLMIGVIGLVSSSAMVTRMIGIGRIQTRAARLAAGRLEILRLAASGTEPRCSASGFSSGAELESPSSALSQTWVVQGTGALRRVSVTVPYRTVYGMRAALLEAGIRC